MSLDSRIISREGDNESGNLISTYERHDEYFKSTAYSTSSLVIGIRQLQTELQAQYQHDKHALTELNKRFSLFIDRVQLLESQNVQYAAQIAELRQRLFDIVDVQWDERYLHLQSDLATISHGKVDYEFDFELFHLQVGIYRQLIVVEQHSGDERRLKLEQELKQTVSILTSLRTSYAELEQKNGSLYVEHEDLSKQYLKLTQDWCNVKKQRKKWDLSLQTLKSQIVCYKNLRSYTRDFGSVPVESVDMSQYWSLELEKCMKKIRLDFELLYAAIYREMTSYYETKMEEIQTEVEQAVHYQQIEIEELAVSIQTLQAEYEEVQKRLSYEQEIQIKLEATYSKLESELKTIQLQQEEQFEAQSKTIFGAQESITTMSYNIDEMRRSKANLEVEIIVYRHLLDCSEVHEQVVAASQAGGNEISEKFLVQTESKRKGMIGIKECAASGKYITLVNHSTNKAIDISRWTLKRRIDSATDVLYKLPEEVRLQQGRELIIYSKQGAGTATSSSDNRVVSTSSHEELVSTDLDSWGMGNMIQTFLLNEHGNEEASHTQTIVFGRSNV